MTEIDTSRDRIEHLRSIDCADYLHMALLARAEKAEAERDTAWSDAIEAAERVVRCYGIPRDVFDAHEGNPRPALAEAIRALRK